jgi:hypothetical protein
MTFDLDIPPFFSPDPRLLRAGALRGLPLSSMLGAAPAAHTSGDLLDAYQQRADDLYSQGIEKLNAPVDPSAQIEMAKRNQAVARRQLALALAAQEAGKEYGGLSGQFLKRALDLQQPVKVGNAGVVDASGQYVEDPTFVNQQRANLLLQQAQRYDQLAQRAAASQDRMIAAQQAAAMRQQAAAIQQGNAAIQQDLARQRLEETRRHNQLQDQLRQQAAEDKRNATLDKHKQAIDIGESYAVNALRAIDTALKLTSGTTTGVVGSVMRRLPQTDAYALNAALDTIKANVGFETLQKMRAASPTGGALGQVSDMENKLLQATRTSVDQGQDVRQFRQNLLYLKQQFEETAAKAAEARKELARLAASGEGVPAGTVRPAGAPAAAPAAAPADEPPPGAVRRVGR